MASILGNEYFIKIIITIQTKQIQMNCVDITSMDKRNSDKSKENL